MSAVITSYVFSGAAGVRDMSTGPIGSEARSIVGAPYVTAVRVVIPATMLTWRLDWLGAGGQGDTATGQLLACDSTATECTVQPITGASIPPASVWQLLMPGRGLLLRRCEPSMNSGNWWRLGNLRLTDGTGIGVAWTGVAQLDIAGES